MKSQLLVIDTLDDRRELHTLLHKLPPADRIRFLVWACRQAKPSEGKLPAPYVQRLRTTTEQAYRCDRADLALTNEIYCDILSLLHDHYRVDAVKLACEAEKWARDPSHRRAAIASLSAAPPASFLCGLSRTSGSGT